MIKNYLKIAWRNLLRNRSFSIINILGLSIGVATCLLIFFYVHYESSYDTHHSKKDRVVRISAGLHAPDGDINLATSPTLLVTELRRSFPEIETAARLKGVDPVVNLNNDLFREEDMYYSEQEIFDVFDFEVKKGSLHGSLKDPQSAVLTESLAKKYFGNNDPIGQIIKMDGKLVTVKAVIANPPANSDVKIKGLLSYDFSRSTYWLADDFEVLSYALFRTTPNLTSFNAKLKDVSSKIIQPELNDQGAKDYRVIFGVQRLTDVHYTTGLLNDSGKGNKQLIYMFSLLAIFILTIAVLNYINLSTARATERAKEVGVRKVNGARPGQLIRQFLFESLLLITIAWLLAIVTALLVLPFFNRLFETGIHFSWSEHIGFMLLAFVLTLVFAGLYPAFVLSRFKPVEILKGKWRHSKRGVIFRKSLTVVQFVLTSALITGAVVIYSQMKFISNKDLGFQTKNVLNFNVAIDSVSQHQARALINSLRNTWGNQNVTAGAGMRGEGMSLASTFAETEQGTKRELMSAYQFADKEFIPFFGIQLKEGRLFSDSLATDKDEAFIVNEAYVKNMKWQKPLGKSMEGYGKKGKVIGVVKNYYYQSLRETIRPTIIVLNRPMITTIAVKTEARNIPKITEQWKAVYPSLPFEYEFLDEAYAENYKKDRNTQALFTFFTALAIFISMMGLYGLVSLMAVQRAKEIGVRKVLGASLSQLLTLLSKGFVRLIIIAAVLAAPLAWLGMNRWLQDYAYHISLSWWMFVLPVFMIVLVAMIVIARQIITAALANPVKALRAE